MPLLRIVQCADGFFEPVFDAAPPIGLTCNLRLELALLLGEPIGGREPFLFGARVCRFDNRVSLSELERQPIDVGCCRCPILIGALHLECRRAQLLVDHVPGRRSPRHADLVLGLELRQLPIGGRDGRFVASLCLVKGSRRARELLLEIDARRSLDRARDDDRQIAEQGLILLNVAVGARLWIDREFGPIRHDHDNCRVPCEAPQGRQNRRPAPGVDRGFHHQRGNVSVLIEPSHRMLEMSDP